MQDFCAGISNYKLWYEFNDYVQFLSLIRISKGGGGGGVSLELEKFELFSR